jgi:hypothetical protein
MAVAEEAGATFEQPTDGRLVGRLCTVVASCKRDAEWTAQDPYGERIDACAEHLSTGLLGRTAADGSDLVPRRINPPEGSESVVLANPDAAHEVVPLSKAKVGRGRT